jgi:diguanylate cyclase (GGDEF)-like protein
MEESHYKNSNNVIDAKQSKIQSIQICLFLSLLALGSNLFLKINVVGDTYLMFGSAFAFIGLFLLPFAYVVPIVICVFITFLIGDVNLPMAIIFLAEVSALAYLRTRNIFILMGSIMYWVSIGIPVLWVLNSLDSSDIPDSGLILTLQSAFNGVLNAALAATLFACLPKDWGYGRVSAQHRLSSNIFTICASTLVLPLLIVSFVFIYQGIHLAKQSKLESLSNKGMLLDNVTTNFIVSHQTTIDKIALVISAGGEESKYQKLMIDSQRQQQTFFNITEVSREGDLVFFAPTKYNALLANIPKDYKNISDRLYFQQSRDTLSHLVTDTFLSRGIVIAPMISIASPVLEDGKFNGIVFGALNLFGISSFEDEMSAISGHKLVVITDQKGNVVFSNKPDTFKALTPFVFEDIDSRVLSEMALMRIGNQTFIYGQTDTVNDWRVYVIDTVESISESVRDQFALVGIGLAIVLSVFLILAYKLSNKITQPLVALLKDEDGFPTDELSANHTSREISDMAKKLKRSSYLMRNFENRLKLQVTEKTEQLEQLNLQLAAQAREDGLTGLYNRSGFNELAINAIKTSYRIGQPFSVVIIDIDHFKNVNDTYGHIVGDKCLIEFANLMQTFCKRETDIIGRYGGEEFIIFMSGTEVQAQYNIINDIHQKTRLINVLDDDSGKSVSFTVSVGVCTVLSAVTLELSELINIADDELYRCKRGGRDRVSITTIGD